MNPHEHLVRAWSRDGHMIHAHLAAPQEPSCQHRLGQTSPNLLAR